MAKKEVNKYQLTLPGFSLKLEPKPDEPQQNIGQKHRSDAKDTFYTLKPGTHIFTGPLGDRNSQYAGSIPEPYPVLVRVVSGQPYVRQGIVSHWVEKVPPEGQEDAPTNAAEAATPAEERRQKFWIAQRGNGESGFR